MPNETSTRGGRVASRWPGFLAGVYGSFTAVVVFVWMVAGDTGWGVTVNALQFWWALPAIPLLLLALLLRRSTAALFLAVPAVLWVWAYGGLFWGSAPVPEGDLRVATYNTYIRAPDLSHVVSLVRDERPDVLLLQEVLPRQRDGLRSLLGRELPHSWFGEPGRIGGIGLMSRYPIVEVRGIPPLRRVARPTAVVVLDVDGTRVQVVPVHFTSPCPRCGESLIGRLAEEANSRRAEAQEVLAALDEELPAIVGGDLNSTRRNDAYRHFASAGFRDPQIEAGSGPGFTWPDGTGPLVRIDWVLARGLVPAAAWVDPPRASDHHPVIVDLAVPR